MSPIQSVVKRQYFALWTWPKSSIILQAVPGFDECITRMRDGDIEGTYAELDFGRMLYLNKVPFRFVVPQGTTGFDYDIEVEYRNGVVAAADAKCKIESTDFGESTIKNTLNKARKQLPDASPGIVFVKVPQEVAAFAQGPSGCEIVSATYVDYKKAGPLLFSTDHRGTEDGKPLHVWISDVSVKLTGSEKWINAQ
jgi:hypothetical protein